MEKQWKTFNRIPRPLLRTNKSEDCPRKNQPWNKFCALSGSLTRSGCSVIFTAFLPVERELPASEEEHEEHGMCEQLCKQRGRRESFLCSAGNISSLLAKQIVLILFQISFALLPRACTVSSHRSPRLQRILFEIERPRKSSNYES